MKNNKIARTNLRQRVAAVVALVLLAASVTGVALAYVRLRDMWHEPAALANVAAQVKITTGKMVKPDAIREALGLVPGANLATLDLAKNRAETLQKYPMIREIAIERHLPDAIEVTVVEREPAIRLGLKGRTQDTGRVADTEGVVFTCRRGTRMLPMIRELAAAATPVGARLSGRGRAALRLLTFAPDPEFASLGVLEVDVTKPDYLVATLGNYSRAKIVWDGMDEGGPDADRALRTQLGNLVAAIGAGLQSETRIWNATIPGKIFCDNQGVN